MSSWKMFEGIPNFFCRILSSITCSLLVSDLVDTKNHPDEYQMKWKCTNQQALFSVILAGVFVCALFAMTLVMKHTTGDPNSSSKCECNCLFPNVLFKSKVIILFSLLLIDSTLNVDEIVITRQWLFFQE